MTKVTLDTNGIASQMKQKFPELESVVVTVPIVGNRPVIYVAPAHPVLKLETASGSYVLSSKGFAYHGDMTDKEIIALPQLIDLSGVRPDPGKPFLPLSTVTFALAVQYQLSKASIAVDALMLPQGAPFEFDVRLVGKPYIIKLNLQEDPVVQSGAVVAVVQKLGGALPGQYIDVRVPGRAYYK